MQSGCVFNAAISNGTVSYVVLNATLLPSVDEMPPTILVHDVESHVQRMRLEMARCRDRFFDESRTASGKRSVQLRAAGEERPLTLASDDDLVILLDAFGMKSIYHSIIDNLFPLATTARLLLGLASYRPLTEARTRLYVLNQATLPINEYTSQMQTAMLGLTVQSASEIVPARYSQIAVGTCQSVRPVRQPATGLWQLRHDEGARKLWLDWHHVLRRRVVARPPWWQPPAIDGGIGQMSSRSPAAAGAVWLERDPLHANAPGPARQWSEDQLAALLTEACPSTTPSKQQPLWPSSATGAQSSRCWLTVRSTGRLPFREQALALRDAKLVAGFEGAGFVNAIFMPRGGTMVIIDPLSRYVTAWQWGYAQYLHAQLVYVAIPHDLDGHGRDTRAASSVGRVLRLVWWDGHAGVCGGVRNTSELLVFTLPAQCEPLSDRDATEPRLKWQCYCFKGCRCHVELGHGEAPARSQQPVSTGRTIRG